MGSCGLCHPIVLVTLLILLATGIPVCAVYSLKWKASVVYEEESVVGTCTVLSAEKSNDCGCKTKQGKVIGYKYVYQVKTSLCGEKVISRTDDNCNSNALAVGLVRDCRIHRDCDSFKWRSHAEVNRVGAMVGAAIVILAMLVFFVAILPSMKKGKKEANPPPPPPPPPLPGKEFIVGTTPFTPSIPTPHKDDPKVTFDLHSTNSSHPTGYPLGPPVRAVPLEPSIPKPHKDDQNAYGYQHNPPLLSVPFEPSIPTPHTEDRRVYGDPYSFSYYPTVGYKHPSITTPHNDDQNAYGHQHNPPSMSVPFESSIPTPHNEDRRVYGGCPDSLSYYPTVGYNHRIQTPPSDGNGASSVGSYPPAQHAIHHGYPHLGSGTSDWSVRAQPSV